MRISFYNLKCRKILAFVITFLSLIMISLFFLFSNKDTSLIDQKTEIRGLNATSQDGYIEINWEGNWARNLKKYYLVVEDEEGNVVEEQELEPICTSCLFEKGKNGKRYTIRVSMILSDDMKTVETIISQLFLEYDKIPKKIPFINVETVDGEMPSFEAAKIPEYGIGFTITNNEYKSADLSVREGEEEILLPGQIRVRGNTSAIQAKKSYKIELNAANDLLNTGEQNCLHKEWLLIAAENLNFLVGTETAVLCGAEWQPRYQCVNLMINGEYQGLYWLTEAIDEAVHQFHIEPDGYMIELDAYWWNRGEYYFKLDDQAESMGFTFKYPKEEYLDEKAIANMQNFMDAFQQHLYDGNPKYEEYIDLQSFARWILTHDILGTWDCGGSNMFYYKRDFDESMPLNSKVCMGPVWDFDTIYMQEDDWARVRYLKEAFFPILFTRQEFQSIYLELWNDISPTIVQEIDRKVNYFVQENGTALNESIMLESVRWEREPKLIQDEEKIIREWFEQRKEWIEARLED